VGGGFGLAGEAQNPSCGSPKLACARPQSCPRSSIPLLHSEHHLKATTVSWRWRERRRSPEHLIHRPAGVCGVADSRNSARCTGECCGRGACGEHGPFHSEDPLGTPGHAASDQNFVHAHACAADTCPCPPLCTTPHSGRYLLHGHPEGVQAMPRAGQGAGQPGETPPPPPPCSPPSSACGTPSRLASCLLHL
jgi:hypothetical protein